MKWLVFFLVTIISLPTSLVRAQQAENFGSYTDDARAARIAELRSKYRISLSADEKQAVVGRCDTVRASIGRLSEKVDASTATRLDTYDAVIATLTSLRALLANKQIDASNLELLIVDYQKSRTNFAIATTSYQTAIDDSLAVDCANDPESFRASIEGLREGRKKSADIANEIEELTESTLMTVFDTVRAKFESARKLESNGS